MPHFAAAMMVSALTTGTASASESTCTYQLTAAKPGWTAYKTTDKLPVAGTFADTTLSGATAAGSVPDALSGVSMAIVASSVDSGLDVRNTTLATEYFAKFAPDTPFTVSVSSVEGSNTAGTATLTIDVNGKSKAIAFPYAVSDAGELTAKANMDMMDFALNAAFDSIHKACELLHTGPDGVSKTWTDVELSVTATIAKSCK